MATYNGNNLPSDLNLVTGDIINWTYSGSYKSITLPKGKYRFECYGAPGGIAQGPGSSTSPGNGGYSKGDIELQLDQLLHMYVGYQGNTQSCLFNGGGSGSQSINNSAHGVSSACGGGASDIRLVSGTWNSAASLRSRIMVAGGGGGTSYRPGAAGGGISGTNGTASTGGTQISGGGFGSGSSGQSYASSPYYGGSGCGGGYWGGLTTGAWTGGAGGSGFVSGLVGCNAIISATNQNPSGQPNHYSGLIFTNASMTNGGSTSPLIRVTALDIDNTRFLIEDNNQFKYYKDNNWKII